MFDLLPISIIIPTRNRALPFTRTLASLAQQGAHAREIVVVDGSDDGKTKEVCSQGIEGLKSQIFYYRATIVGAASQRNQAFAYSTQDFIWLLDDDVFLEENCLVRLWNALESNPRLGGVNAMITNQQYLPPGPFSRRLFCFLHGSALESYAGKCIGPAMNLLPEDRDDLPEVVPVEWLNTTCTLYRRVALPNPPFQSNFVGYSLMEDVTLSLTVGKEWKLANVRSARIFHDSQPGDHKNDPAVLAKMSLVNRHFVMTQLLHRHTFNDYLKLTILQLFDIAASLQKPKGWLELPAVLLGKLSAVAEIMTTKSNSDVAPESVSS
jgi:glycosyltransferase involved in cell wall biosynthesis